MYPILKYEYINLFSVKIKYRSRSVTLMFINALKYTCTLTATQIMYRHLQYLMSQH